MEYFFAVVPPPELQQRVTRSFHGLEAEPHITVKAQGGLDPKSIEVWLPRVAELAGITPPIDVTLKKPDVFGDAVLHLPVDSPGLKRLHDALMQSIDVSAADVRTYFEGDEWVPHLTFKHGADLTVAQYEAETAFVLELPTFVCRSLVLFSRTTDGYRRYRELELAG